jgi:hypothetical protein
MAQAPVRWIKQEAAYLPRALPSDKLRARICNWGRCVLIWVVIGIHYDSMLNIFCWATNQYLWLSMLLNRSFFFIHITHSSYLTRSLRKLIKLLWNSAFNLLSLLLHQFNFLWDRKVLRCSFATFKLFEIQRAIIDLLELKTWLIRSSDYWGRWMLNTMLILIFRA